MTRLAGLLIATSLFASACAGGTEGPPLDRGSTPTPGIATAGAGVGTLPDSGAMVRVVNLYTDESGPQAIDVYGFGGTDIVSEQILVASVAHGAVSDWFDPGYVEGSAGSHTVNVEIRRKGAADKLGGVADVSIVAGSRATVIIGPPDTFGAPIRVALDTHPDTTRGDVPRALPDAGLLVTSHEGLPSADFERSVFYASVGSYCLRGTISDPDFEAIVGHPLGQPIGNQLVVEPGSHTLTIHTASDEPGAIETCASSPVAQATLQIAGGGRAYAFLYAQPGSTAISLLVVPFEG